MAVAHDADSTANSGAVQVASLTWSHTTTGANTLLVVGLTYDNSSTTMSITHAGNAPTGFSDVVDANATTHTRFWWWVAPTTGAQNIIATPSASCDMFGGGATFTGVDQTNPISDRVAFSGSTFGTIGHNIVTTVTGAMIMSFMGLSSASSTLTAVSPATQAYNASDGTANRIGAGQYWLAGSNGMQAMAWTISGVTTRPYAHQLLAIRPSGAEKFPHVKFNNSGLRPHPFSPGLAR